MKRQTLLLISVLFFHTNALAVPVYVKDIDEITMRSEPKSGKNIITMIPSTQRMELINSSSEWAQIKLPDGRTGWVTSRFLSNEIPNVIKLEQLKQKYDRLEEESRQLKQANEKFSSELNSIKSESSKSKGQFSGLAEAHDRLKKDCENVMQLQADYKVLMAEYEKMKLKAETLDFEIMKLLRNMGLFFYLSGACVLGIGIMIGFWVKRLKKRSAYI